MRLPSQTVRGGPPREETSSTRLRSSAGILPPWAVTYFSMASAAPLRMMVPSGRSTPLMRVCAENSMKLDLGSSSTWQPSLRPSSTVDLPSGVPSRREVRTAQRISSSLLAPPTG